MDFPDMIKSAWRVTWRHKTLWVLGLFAGATGGGLGGWGSSGGRSDSLELGDWGSVAWQRAETFAYDWAAVLIAGAVALLVVGLLWLLLSITAQAGLVWEVDVAERGGTPSASEGWNVGFHHWWRVLGVGVMLMLPVVLLALLGLALAVATMLPVLHAWSVGGLNPGVGWASLAGLIALAVVSVPILVVLSFVLGNMYVLAVRYVVIEHRPPVEAVRASWQALRHRFKDVLLMWLVSIGLSIGVGIAIAIPAGTVAAGIAMVAFLGAWPFAVVLGFFLFAVMVVVGAAWNTFTSALWTVFFRRLTGREVRRPVPDVTAHGYPTHPYQPSPVVPDGLVPTYPPAYPPADAAPSVATPPAESETR